jgi:hypothetical protein
MPAAQTPPPAPPPVLPAQPAETAQTAQPSPPPTATPSAPPPAVPPPAVPPAVPPPAVPPPAVPPSTPQPPDGDDFAALPRIRPFTDFELDPVDPPGYTGRRRRVEGNEAAYGRHARPGEAAGRRFRPDEDAEPDDDLLARLLPRDGGS